MEIKSLRGLTKTLWVFLALNFAFHLLFIGTRVFGYYTYLTLDQSIDNTMTILPSLIVIGVLVLCHWVVYIITAIIFLDWVKRVNTNLRALSGEEMRFTPGWSIGWYFVPFMNIYKPYQVMKELWRVVHKQEIQSDFVVSCWWFFCVFAAIFGRMSNRTIRVAEQDGNYIFGMMIGITNEIVGIIVCIFAMNLVISIGEAYGKNFEGQPPMPKKPLHVGAWTTR